MLSFKNTLFTIALFCFAATSASAEIMPDTTPSHSQQPAPSNLLPSNLKAAQGKKTALIIGNATYQSSPLKNPVHDAKDMANALSQLGFEVIAKYNANQEQMEDAIRLFGSKISNSDVNLFYYAGHGVQVAGRNYLIPINAKIVREKDVKYKAVDANQVLDEMGSADSSLNMVILDACRDNPLPRSFRSSGQQGLAKLDGPKGTIIAYATGPGSTAMDGTGRNGVYTKHLLKAISTPNLSVEEVFKQVLQQVDNETSGQQTPWVSSSFTGNFSFNMTVDDRGLTVNIKPLPTQPVEEPETGILDIATVPTKSAIRIDGAFTGYSPMSISLPPGTYQLALSAKGYKDFQDKVLVRSASTTPLELYLDKVPAKKPITPPKPIRPKIPALTAEQAKFKITQFYRDKGEWKGVFMIRKVNRIRMVRKGKTTIVHAKYQYIPVPNSRRSDSGTDQRIFQFRWNGRGWKVIRMGAYKSGKF
ncbi:MAG: PEGA domain-containing protein [Methylococcales bacterium]|jgi:hypothetical protein|nr:PEGA domain-containing protein [Methylococcales bacterium]MBT7443879.1 PEGA domain-containing protein [Methylococcales bacterium]